MELQTFHTIFIIVNFIKMLNIKSHNIHFKRIININYILLCLANHIISYIASSINILYILKYI